MRKSNTPCLCTDERLLVTVIISIASLILVGCASPDRGASVPQPSATVSAPVGVVPPVSPSAVARGVAGSGASLPSGAPGRVLMQSPGSTQSVKPPKGRPVKDESSLEATSRSEALKQWRFRPILVAGGQLEGARERWFISKRKPPSDSTLHVWYERGSASVDDASFGYLRWEGSILVSMYFTPADTKLFTPNPDEYKWLTVRGQKARMEILTTHRKDGDPAWVQNADIDRRSIAFDRRVGAGTVTWVITSDPDRYDEDVMVSMINDLRELAGS